MVSSLVCTLFSRKKFRFYVLLPCFYWLVLGFFIASSIFWRWFECAVTTITGLGHIFLSLMSGYVICFMFNF